MHLGSQTLIKKSSIRNFKYFLFNNGSHFSTGGNVPSNISNINLELFARSVGLNYFKINKAIELKKFMKKRIKSNYFVELVCNDVHIDNIPRPKLKQISFNWQFIKDYMLDIIERL